MIIQFTQHKQNKNHDIHQHIENAVCCIDKLMQCLNDIKDCVQLLEHHETEEGEAHE